MFTVERYLPAPVTENSMLLFLLFNLRAVPRIFSSFFTIPAEISNLPFLLAADARMDFMSLSDRTY